MIEVTSFESFRQRRSEVPTELKADVAVPTVMVEHSDYSELLWALRLTEFFGDASRSFGYQPNVQWRDDGTGEVSYTDSPMSADVGSSGVPWLSTQIRPNALGRWSQDRRAESLGSSSSMKNRSLRFEGENPIRMPTRTSPTRRPVNRVSNQQRVIRTSEPRRAPASAPREPAACRR